MTSPPASTPAATLAWDDPARARAFHIWLQRIGARHDLHPETLRVASADASFRRYFRIGAGSGTRVIMDAPPERESGLPFVRVAKLMQAAQIRAPEVLEWDADHGFMLLSDLGQRTMLQVMDSAHPSANRALYENALDLLLRWQQASHAGVLSPYDAALLRRELELFPEWYLARHRGVAVEGAVRETLDAAFDRIVQQNLAAPSVYVHRDFMPRNLILADGTSAAQPRLGVLDFQDAVFGPVTYDIASLMRDAFHSWDEEFTLDITIRYWERAKKLGLMDFEDWASDFGSFWRAVEWMGLQRHLKVAGIFARLTLRDGKPKYLADAPRFIAYIRHTCQRYRELKPLLRLIDQVEGIEEQSGWAFGRM